MALTRSLTRLDHPTLETVGEVMEREALLALSQLHSIESEAQRRGMPQEELERRHYRKDVAVQKAIREGRDPQATRAEATTRAEQIVGRAPAQEDRGPRGGRGRRGDRGDRGEGRGDRGRS